MILAPLPILTRGHAALKAVAQPVVFPDAELSAQLAALHATLADFRARSGFGRALAAPQAGIGKRIIVMHLGATPFVLINPVITWRSDALFDVWDDCLSVPECLVLVRRHCSVSLRYLDERGRERTWAHLPEELSELVQHEIDHLDGVLMTERAAGGDAVRPAAERAQWIDAERTEHRLSLAGIARSADAIPPEFRGSPQYNCEPLSEALGCALTLKLEFTNPIRSFKGRGASYFLSERLRRGDTRAIVCASAGNWGQAMAYVCRARGLPIVVFASVHANPLKVARMRALGAQVLQVGEDFDAAKDAAAAYARQTGGQMVEDGLEPEISEGHGTIAMELLAQGDMFDAFVIPLGNGAMLNGIGRWIKAASPATRVIGVVSTAADAMEKSWRGNTLVQTETADTIADGIAVRVPVPAAVQDMRGIADDVLRVDDAHIIEAMRQVHRHAGLLVEPAGAVGVAALVAHREYFAGQRVATVLCGSNLTREQEEHYLRDADDPSGGA